MERAPSRAKATNILRPSSRAQGPSFGENGAPAHLTPSRQGMYNLDSAAMGMQGVPASQAAAPGMPQARILPGGARVITPSHAGQAPMGGAPLTPGGMRRPPSAAQFLNQQLDQSHMASFAPADQATAGGPGTRQRLNSYYEGMPAGDPPAVARSGSRAEIIPSPGMHQPQRAPSRSGRPNTAAGIWPGQMLGQVGQMGLSSFFGGGFGSMGGGIGGPVPQMPLQQQPPPQQQPMFMAPAGGRPGSSLQAVHPSRPATSAGIRHASGDASGPVLVNVARGGARVIGPMRAKAPGPDGNFLNPIPQSPPSAVGAFIPSHADQQDARENLRSALSSNSLESSRSRSNSVAAPTEESMEAAEARVSRKIQDLEISNKSLLAVNTQLEARVKAQREKINELKKQLQLKVPFLSDGTAEIDASDEALRTALKEDKVFERLISNLEHLIQDAKDAIEYRSTIAAGKVISAADLTEGRQSSQYYFVSTESGR
ncbi:hypothetical protein GQ54DRAFT_85445 [Martensiomyces pterosporus]|nr:hypothetical protein GQ54DRAFT_85445 [Martensiomyces pterosporus]